MRIPFLRRLLTAMLAAVCLAVPAAERLQAQAGATARRTVRVGISDADTQAADGSDNTTVIFEKNYFQAIAEYANWDYEYVEASWSRCLQMAMEGTIDVLMDVSPTEERRQYLDFSSEAMGTEMSCLVASSGTRLSYDDFKAFDGMTVGYEQGSTLVDSLRKYGRRMGFSFLEQPYQTGAQMFSALDAGQVDAVLRTNFMEMPDGHVILAEFDPSPVYIVTSKKNPSLINELDDAMAKLFSYSPSFNADLYRSVFGNSHAQSEGFTQQEQAYLDTKPVVIVPYEKDWAPFEMEANGQPVGITPDVIRAIGRDTGISFKFVEASSTQAIYDGMDGSAVDMVMAVSYDYLWANSHGLSVTQPYVTGSVMRVTKDPDTEPSSVAVAAGGYLANKISRAYPGLRLVEYQTFEECMAAVASGAADCTFLNYYQANYYRSLSSFDTFTYKPIEDITQSIGLGVTKGSNTLLLGILSKSLQRIAAEELQGILSENVVQPEELTPRTAIRRYPVQTAVVIALFSILLCLLAVMIFSAGIRRRRSRALAEAKAEAEAANRAKSDFLSRMSHDIRTPLNGIIGMTYIAQQQANSPETARCLGKIDTSSKFLLGLVNEILDMSKAESGLMELHPEPYYIDDFKGYIAAVIQPLCDEKDQTLKLQTHVLDAIVPKMDILRTNQIYFNLLSNAVKYTPEGGQIAVTLDESIVGAKVRISATVSDNGIGMSEQFQKVLFDPFTQERHDESAESKGTGLGLAIVKKIIDAMGGTIKVDSHPGEGTTFAFVIDCDYLAADNTHPRRLPSGRAADLQALAGRHVLLCEDHPLNQEIARTILQEKGVIVDIADNGARGVDHFSRSAIRYYDAILMDIRMPVMDGCQAARAIRSLDRPDAKDVPIVAMTADAFSESVQAARQAGMDGYVTKPVEPARLYQALTAAIQSRQEG